MKKYLALLLALAMVFALCACGSTAAPAADTTASSEPAAAADAPKTEDAPKAEEPAPAAPAKEDVIIGTSTEPNGDWAYGAFTSSINATDQDVITLTDDYVTVTSNEGGDYVINETIVKNYERTEDEDGNATYTFEINEGLVFNNGDPVTAENFLAWTLFVISPAGKEMGTVSNAYNMIPGGPDYKDGAVNYLAGIRLLGEYEFSMTVLATGYDGQAYLPYYYDLANAGMRAVNLDYWFGPGWHVADDGEGAYLVNDNGTEFTKDNIADFVTTAQYATSDRVTAGPYNLVNFDKAATEVTLEINPNYAGDFQGQKPIIKKLVIVRAEDETILDTIATGGIDLYSGIADGAQVNALIDMIEGGEIDSDYCRYDRAGFGYFQFACDLGPAQWKEFRQAVAMCLDRNEFANTFCAGWGGVVHGPYCTAFTMYKDSKELLANNLNTYDYNPEGAAELLKSIGFVFNADGTDYVDGSGLVRYKEVTKEEAENYEDFCVEADGKLLMPATLNWASSEGNSVSDLLSTMLANGEAAKQAGIELKQNIMSFPELLNYMYRQDAYGLGGDYSVPTYNMFNLATGWSSGAYDFSYEFTTDEAYIMDGYHTTHLYDEELDKLSMDMVYGVEPGDYDTYLDIWQQFVVRYNEMLPRVPLYANIYVSVFPNSIVDYQEGPFWGFSRAILYADYAA